MNVARRLMLFIVTFLVTFICIGLSLAETDLEVSLSNLTVNDKTIAGFEADKRDYIVVLPYGTIDVPVVDVTTKGRKAKYDIIPTESVPGKTGVRVTSEDGKSTKIYLVNFKTDDLHIDELFFIFIKHIEKIAKIMYNTR